MQGKGSSRKGCDFWDRGGARNGEDPAGGPKRPFLNRSYVRKRQFQEGVRKSEFWDPGGARKGGDPAGGPKRPFLNRSYVRKRQFQEGVRKGEFRDPGGARKGGPHWRSKKAISQQKLCKEKAVPGRGVTFGTVGGPGMGRTPPEAQKGHFLTEVM